MNMYNLGLVKELVNAFNISNYGSRTNTNFVVEGDNIVVKFNCDKGSAKRYLSQMARDLVREYYSDEFVACHVFDLESFPFHFDKKWLKYDKKTRITKLTVPIDSRVIFNLKVHFAEEFENDVEDRVIKKIDEKHHLGKKRIEETLNASIKQAKMDPSSSYIKCLLFNGPNLQTYFVMALQAQMEEHGCSYSDFYHIDGNKVYVKDVENIGFIRNITEASKKEVGYNFYLQHSDNLKVKAKHYKDAIGELIFRLTEISIHRYYYDEFIDKDKISNGDRFAFIPTIKEGNISRYLNRGEANKINAQFGYDLLTDIKGQTETTRSGRFGGVYAFSNRQIALLIPVIIENSVINKDGQIEIDPGLPRTLLTEPSLKQESPTRSQGVGLGESPRQGLEESFMLHKKLDVPGTSGEFLPRSHLSYTAVSQGIEKCVSAAQNVQAGPSTWSQPMNPLLSQSTSGNKWTSSTQFTQPGPSGLSWTQSRPSSSKGADESMLIEIRGQQVRYRPSLTPSPIAWDDSTFLNLEVSNEEPEKQQVTDESDRKSSDECSEAKSQDSKSPEKKHGGGLQKIKKLLSSPFKKQYGVNLKRHDVGRDTTRSTPETPVTEKPPVSKLFSSFPARIRARSNPSSAVTSPTHEGASGGLKPLTSDERKELRLFLSPELQKKLDSNSFSPGKERLLYLTHTPEGKRELSRFLCESKESQLRRLAEAQLSSPDNSNRDSGFSSMGSPASPVVQHKGSAPLKVTECSVQQVNSHSVERT